VKGAPIAAALVALGLAAAAAGHTRSVSYSSVEIDAGGARLRLRVPLLELTRVPPERLREEGGLAEYLARRLALRAGETPCAAEAPEARQASEGLAVFEWRVACPAAGERRLESRLLLDVAPSHLHFTRVRLPDGQVVERVLSEAEPDLALPGAGAPRARGTSLAGYLRLGVEHILTGFDHLAFVAALLLLATTLGEVATLVTAFTLAHSVTLSLGALGVLEPRAAAIETLIGFSIALVAAENAWLLGGRGRALPRLSTAALLGLAGLAAAGIGTVPWLTLLGVAVFTACHFGILGLAQRPARLRAAVAFCFGLVHGFGFAGLLAEFGLPVERRVPALFGFNLGVEVGQLAVVLLLWPALQALARRRDGRLHALVAELGSAAVCGVGVFWFVTRLFG
jgi:hypothetical protein